LLRFLAICLGGAVGTGARYLLAGWVQSWAGSGFPWGTLAVNVIGSFVIAALLHVATTTDLVSPTARLTLAIGVLGGFTTYSTFNWETLRLLREGAFALATANVAATLVACMAAGFLGLAAGRLIAGE
jgi:CrcB protein